MLREQTILVPYEAHQPDKRARDEAEGRAVRDGGAINPCALTKYIRNPVELGEVAREATKSVRAANDRCVVPSLIA